MGNLRRGNKLSGYIVGIFTKQLAKPKFLGHTKKNIPFFKRNTLDILFGCVIYHEKLQSMFEIKRMDKGLNELKLGVLHLITMEEQLCFC